MARPKKAAGEKYIRQDISMEPEQLKRLMEVCQQQERSISWVVRKALENYLKKSENVFAKELMAAKKPPNAIKPTVAF